MNFSRSHFWPDEDRGLRLKTDCVPGRLGCVLEDNAVFAVPAEQRVREREAEKCAPGQTYFSFAHTAWRGQVTRWSLTMPLACMNA